MLIMCGVRRVTHGGNENRDRGGGVGKERLVHWSKGGMPAAKLYACTTRRTEKERKWWS